ncbi:DUF1214 domain-containing protein [Shewanella sp. UCD-KL12]|uniref:DUF1214 domain-containing protein n=1 Tax=Shewanella sp. UCD-KL12 TaxID=1917163 RepID=UPI000970BB2B|nr:DUF1214 domain-containing protein [Shewanella sp. UCD-KL12]
MKKTNTLSSLAIAVALGMSTTAIASEAPNAPANDTKAVTVNNFVEAEMDARLYRFFDEGGLNVGMVFNEVTPTDRQPVPRMNRDTLYAGIQVDTSKGYTITIPEHADDRYASVYILDNEHKTLHILKGSGTTHHFDKQEDTRWIAVIPRVQVFDAKDDADVAIASNILNQIKIESGNMQPKPMVNWDWEQMIELRSQYEVEMRDSITQYPNDWQGARGEVDRYKGHNMAVATSWGLFPSSETVYIAQAPELGTDICYSSTYQEPENTAFWSITVYNDQGYMFSDDNNINSRVAKQNQDGSVTMHYGSAEVCGDIDNRLDTTEGWNILMRVYEPDQSVRDGEYLLPPIIAK